ncbi:MAG: SHOCT domain-containing protein [Candidatus Limnocylindrales bacterium]
MMFGLDWGMGGGGWLLMTLGVVLVVAVAWALASATPNRDRPVADDAAQALRTRFARGEITESEYEQAKRLIGI